MIKDSHEEALTPENFLEKKAQALEALSNVGPDDMFLVSVQFGKPTEQGDGLMMIGGDKLFMVKHIEVLREQMGIKWSVMPQVVGLARLLNALPPHERQKVMENWEREEGGHE